MVCVGGSISGPACSQPQSMMVVMVYREKYAFYGKTSVHRWTFMARVEASRHRVTPPRTYCTASTFIHTTSHVDLVAALVVTSAASTVSTGRLCAVAASATSVARSRRVICACVFGALAGGRLVGVSVGGLVPYPTNTCNPKLKNQTSACACNPRREL